MSNVLKTKITVKLVTRKTKSVKNVKMKPSTRKELNVLNPDVKLTKTTVRNANKKKKDKTKSVPNVPTDSSYWTTNAKLVTPTVPLVKKPENAKLAKKKERNIWDLTTNVMPVKKIKTNVKSVLVTTSNKEPPVKNVPIFLRLLKENVPKPPVLILKTTVKLVKKTETNVKSVTTDSTKLMMENVTNVQIPAKLVNLPTNVPNVKPTTVSLMTTNATNVLLIRTNVRPVTMIKPFVLNVPNFSKSVKENVSKLNVPKTKKTVLNVKKTELPVKLANNHIS